MSRLGDSPYDPPGFGTLGGKRRGPREADETDLLRREMYEAPPADAIIDEIRPSGRGGVLWRIGLRCDQLGIERLGVAKLDRSIVDELGLAIGTSWDHALAGRVLDAAHGDAARQYALNALSMRAMSAKRLRDNMARRGTPRPIAERVVEDLERSGLIDDRVLAEQIARSVLSGTPAGARVIEQRLIRRGIGPDLARSVAAEATADRDADEDALRVARKKIRSMAPRLDREVVERRLLGSLARRGFPAPVCRRTAREVVESDWPPRR